MSHPILAQKTVRFIVLRKSEPMRVFTPSPLVAFNNADKDSQVIIIENFSQREINRNELFARALAHEKQLARQIESAPVFAHA